MWRAWTVVVAVAGLCALPASHASQQNAAIPHAHEEVNLAGGAVMVYDQNVPVTLRDGHTVYANVFRPSRPGKYPVILAQTPYGKDATFQEAYSKGWALLAKSHPDICKQSSCRFLRWELVDPERWIGEGYAVVAVDVRGAGYSPGYLELVSSREAYDLYDAIEWAAAQNWSSGRVGLLGISYMAINQWQGPAPPPAH